MMKLCPTCATEKPLDQFSKDSHRPDGYCRYCKTCRKHRRNAPRFRRQRIPADYQGDICCQTCQETKPAADFYLTRLHTRAASCKACYAIKHQAWKDANPGAMNRYTTKWRRANPEKMLAAMEHWRTANPEKAKAATDRWRAAHPNRKKPTREESRAYGRLWRARHPEKVQAATSQWRTAHPDIQKAATKRWRVEHPEQVATMRATRYARVKNAPIQDAISIAVLYKRDKGLCSLCGKHVKRPDASIDHIIPLSTGGEHSYRNTALAHKVCNAKKNNRVATQQMRLF